MSEPLWSQLCAELISRDGSRQVCFFSSTGSVIYVDLMKENFLAWLNGILASGAVCVEGLLLDGRQTALCDSKRLSGPWRCNQPSASPVPVNFKGSFRSGGRLEAIIKG